MLTCITPTPFLLLGSIILEYHPSRSLMRAVPPSRWQARFSARDISCFPGGHGDGHPGGRPGHPVVRVPRRCGSHDVVVNASIINDSSYLPLEVVQIAPKWSLQLPPPSARPFGLTCPGSRAVPIPPPAWSGRHPSRPACRPLCCSKALGVGCTTSFALRGGLHMRVTICMFGTPESMQITRMS